MIRGTSVVLGIGLVILWLVGIDSADVPAWFSWLDLVAAIGAFVVAGMTTPEARARDRVIGPAILAVALLGLWLVGMVTVVPAGMAWWNFVFACAFGALAFLDWKEKPITKATETPFRRSA